MPNSAQSSSRHSHTKRTQQLWSRDQSAKNLKNKIKNPITNHQLTKSLQSKFYTIISFVRKDLPNQSPWVTLAWAVESVWTEKVQKWRKVITHSRSNQITKKRSKQIKIQTVIASNKLLTNSKEKVLLKFKQLSWWVSLTWPRLKHKVSTRRQLSHSLHNTCPKIL